MTRYEPTMHITRRERDTLDPHTTRTYLKAECGTEYIAFTPTDSKLTKGTRVYPLTLIEGTIK